MAQVNGHRPCAQIAYRTTPVEETLEQREDQTLPLYAPLNTAVYFVRCSTPWVLCCSPCNQCCPSLFPPTLGKGSNFRPAISSRTRARASNIIHPDPQQQGSMHATIYVGVRTLEQTSPVEEREERTPVVLWSRRPKRVQSNYVAFSVKGTGGQNIQNTNKTRTSSTTHTHQLRQLLLFSTHIWVDQDSNGVAERPVETT